MPTIRWLAGVGVVVAMVCVLGGRPSTLAHEADGHPARIQHGTCDNLGEVAFQLTGVGATVSPQGTPVVPAAAIGAESAYPLQTSETTLETGLTPLTRDPYPIVVYESDEAMGQAIACGNLGGVITAQMAGMIMPGDVLTIWLPGTGDSVTTGVAQIEANGTQAIVRLFLANG